MFVRSRKNLLLLELIIVCFFFALSATTSLQVFMLAYERGGESKQLTEAMIAAQSWAEIIAADEQPEQMLLDNGWAFEGDEYRLEGEDGFILSIRAGREAQPAGELLRAELTVYHRRSAESALVTLPIVKYLPGSGVGAQ